MTFHDRQLSSMTFQAWKLKYFNFMTFQVFHDPYEPCMSHWSGAKESREIERAKLEHSVLKTAGELPHPNPNK